MESYKIKLYRNGSILETVTVNSEEELITKATFIKSLDRYKFNTIYVKCFVNGNEVYCSLPEKATRTIEQPTRTIEDILKEVTERHGVDVKDLMKKSPERRLADIRAEYYYLCISDNHHAIEIGKAINRDRTTVITMAKKYREWNEIYQKQC